MSRYISFNYEYDNSENHFCDDMNFSLYRGKLSYYSAK